MSKAWFVTGTDTGVGKTAISCALLTAAAQAGLRTAAIKPVAAGCEADGTNEDGLLLQAAITESMDYSQVNPVALREAIAPHIAANLEGKRLQASRLAGLCRGVMLGTAEIVLIEGAGGWRVPINSRETMADLARELGVGVILVVGMQLGCINHALLTAEAIRRDGLQLAAWIANQTGPRMPRHEENLATLRDMLGAPLLGDVPYHSHWEPKQLALHLNIAPLLA